MLAIFSRLGHALSLGARIRKQRARQSRNHVQRLEQLEDRTLLSAVTQYDTFLDTDWISTGAGGFDTFFEEPTGNADLTFSVPEGSTITNALLVWQGIDRTSYGGDGVYDNAQVQFGGNSVTGTSLGTSDTANWGAGSSEAFVADVTQFMTGSGTYSVAGLSGKVGHTANGVSLFVMYDDGDVTNNRDVTLLLGNESRLNDIVSGFNYYGGSVSVQLTAADGQSFQDSGLQFNVRAVTGAPVGGATITDTDTILDGNSVPVSQSSRDQVSALWDMHTFDITSAFTGQSLAAGPYTLEMTQLANSNDSLKWIGLAIDQPSDGSLDVNQPPVATVLNFQVAEDTRLDGQLAGYDPDNDPIVAYEIGQQTSHGFLRLAASGGSFSYIPDANFNGVDTFTYRVFDGTSWSPYVTSSITVTPVNDAPIINGATVYVPENGSISYFVEIDDIDGDFLTAYVENQPANGTMTMRFDGTFTYTPNPGFTGQETVIVNVTDGQLVSEATITFIVQPVNQPPVSSNMAFTVNEDTTYFGSLIATDPDGDTLTFRVINNVSNGTLTLNSNGTFQYRGDLNFNGTDSFTYVANDGNVDSAVGTVSITVTAQNDRPVATNQSIVLDEDTVYNGQLTGFDVDGDILLFQVGEGPTQGNLTVNADGSFEYTPGPNFNGEDVFTYFVSDGTINSVSATVTLTITPVNDLPVAGDQSVSLNEDSSYSGVVSGSDVDGDSLTYSVVGSPAHGTLSFQPDGTYTYTPIANYNGPDSFTFTANDGTGDSNVGTVSIQVTPVNDVPVADAASFSGLEDNNITGQLTGSDIDGDALQFVLGQDVSHGVLEFNSDGSFTYTPAANFNGQDTFTFVVIDGIATSQAATVTLNVTAVNDPPVASGDLIAIDEDSQHTGAVAANDADGDALIYSVISGPTRGELTFSDDGTYTYTPDPNYNGPDSFTFQASDGTATSNIATVTIQVLPVNDTPTATWTPVALEENSAVGTVAGNVVGADVDGDSLTYQIVAGNSGGAFTINESTGMITVADSSLLDFETTPTFSLTVQVTDPSGASVQLVATIDLQDVDETIPASIDVIPGDDTNVLNVADDKTVDVVISSTSELDIRDIDIDSVTLEIGGVVFSLTRNKRGVPRISYADTNGDGIDDQLTLTFDIVSTGLTDGQTTATLSGLVNGQDFEGNDTVTIDTTSSKGGGGNGGGGNGGGKGKNK